jgi:hypothetical protein
MQDHTSDPARPDAWGDVNLPGAASGPESRSATHDQDLDAQTEPDPSLRQDTNAYAFGATTQQPLTGAGYGTLPLGPGNEAMAAGESPVPRGYTGGAMGKVNAGLSPSFPEAALGDPPPWEAPLRSASEAAKRSTSTAGAQPPRAGHAPEGAPAPASNATDLAAP